MTRTWDQHLQTALRKAVAATPTSVSEQDVMEAALEVAEEWAMRLAEIKAEEEKKGDA